MGEELPDRQDLFQRRQRKIGRYLDELFSKALDSRPFDTLCTLLRVGGMQDPHWDPFEESVQAFDDLSWLIEKASAERSPRCALRLELSMYCQAVEMSATHEVLANLLRCIAEREYVIAPFHHLAQSRRGSLGRIPPSAKAKFREISKLAIAVGETRLVENIDRIFHDEIRNAFSHSDYIITESSFRWNGAVAQQMEIEELDSVLTDCFAFYRSLLVRHRCWLKVMSQMKQYHKWPKYEVLELISSEELGVYGFHVHFSNGFKSTYTRSPEGTEARNMGFTREGSIYFFEGPVDELVPVWKVNGVPFVESE